MKIAFNPSTVAALTSPPNNKDITFDLTGRNIYARGVKFFGTDTWRPVVDNLTSSATDQSLSANMGRYLKSLIDGKADTKHNHDSVYSKLDHNHDERYIKKVGDLPTSAYDVIITPTSLSGSDYTDTGGGIHVKAHTGTQFQLWLHDTSNVWYKKTGTGSWRKMDAGCADQLMTARNINGTPFNGTADITTANWGTARNITIGSTTKAVNGSTNVSWSLSEIGAAASSHNHDGRYVYNYGGTDCKNASLGSSYMGMTTSSGIDSNWWHILSAGWNGEYRWNSQIGFPTQDRSLMYFRSGKDDNSGWGAWKRLALYSEIPSSLKNPNSLIIQTNGTTLGSYDGSSAQTWNITYSNVGAAAASHNHTSLYRVTQINFNADASDSCYIGTTVNSTSTTLDFYLSDDASQESFRWIFADCNSAVGTKTIMQLIPTNNANTALKLYDSYVATQSWVSSQIPTALKNPYSFTVFGVSYDGSSAKIVDKTTFVSTLDEGTSTITDGTMLITSWASNNGFADSGGVNVPYKRKAIHLWEYINSKTNSLYVTSLGTSSINLTWTKNGSTNYITIPGIADNGTHTETASGTTANASNAGMLFGSGMYMTRTYGDSSAMPCSYGNVLNMAGGGSSQLLLGWSGSDSTTAYIYYRSHRDTTSGGWGAWRRLFYADELPSSMKNPNAIKFRDINGTTVSYDGSSACDLTAGTYIAKLPYGFASFTSGASWGNTTGTSFAAWNDSTGGSIDFRRDNPSSGKMSIKVDGRVYVNEGTNPVLSSELGNGFWGMRSPDGGNNWIRTPDYGLIPYVSGSAGSGHSSLGTSTWYFSTAYIDKVYGSLYGNASNIYFSNDATLTLYAITSGQNSVYGTETVGIQSCFDGQNPVTSTYPSTYSNRCQIALQPRGGRVAIGTTNADYMLHVAGDIYSSSCVIAPKFQIGSYGTLYTGSDISPTVGGALANVVISSWYGVSFTSNCCGDYVNTTSVGIDTRYGVIRAAKYEGKWYDYAYDLYTNNTTDTWVPVMNSGKLQHRVIPAAYNNAPSTLDVNSATYAYHLHINSADTWSNWYWSGQSGQPSWLWGSNDGTNMYVWNPSNFSVAQAKRTYNSVTGTGAVELVRGDMADNDQFRILVGGTASNAGYAEIATADDGTEPIYVRQYTGVFSTIKRTLTLLDGNGYSYFPSYINIGGNEGNNSSPNRVWGSNGSDTFLRSYLTSALSVNYANSSGNANYLAYTDVANGVLSAAQTNLSFRNSASGWASYLIFNHEDGNTYYNQIIRMPFWSSPQYARATGNGSDTWYDFITSENIGNYYWANVKISATSSTNTTPTFGKIAWADNWADTWSGGGYTHPWYGYNHNANTGVYSSTLSDFYGITLRTGSTNLSMTSDGKIGVNTYSPSYTLDVNGNIQATGFRHASVNSNDYMLLAGGSYKTLKGTSNDIIFLGCLTLYSGTSGTISSSFYCQGTSVSYTYTRGASNGWINVTIDSSSGIVVIAATAQVQYASGARTSNSGTGRSTGAWWTYCDVYSSRVLHIVGMRQANHNNDSWWRGNPLTTTSGDPGAITVLLFGYKS